MRPDRDKREVEEAARAHYATTGWVLAGLGAFSLVLAVVAVLSAVDLGFIDARSMALISLLMVATGVFMIRGGGT